MFKRSLSWFILVFTLLEFVVKTQLTTYDSSHGFISNNHDRYLANEISSIQDELTSHVMLNNKLNSKLLIKFNPEILDFKQRQLGVPHLEKVTLFNVDSNYSVDMTSISGSTVHFHSSFFENKKIPPLGNTTFNVVFLGREEGTIESNLFIHTTQGHFKYLVKGDSIFSPYRLRPIVSVKIPPNVTFSPFIYFHNPYQVPVQIVEVYCSGGDFHLELPSGELEGPKDLWEIAPHETKAIIKVRFMGDHNAHNHTSYVRIKLNNSEDVLVVPLEIQVSPDALLFTPQGYVDFGIGGSKDVPKRVNLTLCNPLKKPVRIASIATTSKSVSVEMFEHDRIQAMVKDNVKCVDVAQLVLNWSKTLELRDFYGKIVVKYKNSKVRTEIPYHVTVIEGGLTFNKSALTYFTNNKMEMLENRWIYVKNTFRTPIKLINVTLSDEAKQYFQIAEFSAVVLKENEERKIFLLKLAGPMSTQMKLNTFVEMSTNISTFNFPLISYDGKLNLRLSHNSRDNSLDLGLVSVETTKDSYIMFLNTNPVDIKIDQVLTSIPSGRVEIAGCGAQNADSALLQEHATYQNMTQCTTLPSMHYAIVKLTVRSGRSETQIWGDISLNTQYENISIPVHFRIGAGKLEIGPDRLVFDQCFPFKICSHPLRIHSTFDYPMMIDDILSIPPDARISAKHSGHIVARATKIVGTLYLDPREHCKLDCYLGVNDGEMMPWLLSFGLGSSAIADGDLNLVNVLYHRYLNETVKEWQNLTMRLDTSEVRAHFFKTRVKMSWPSLVVDNANKTVVFPLTQVGNVSYQNVTLRNPSSYDLLVQIVMDTFYPQFDVLFEGLPLAFLHNADLTSKKTSNHGFFMETILRDLGSGVLAHAHKESISLCLKPNEMFTFRVGFRANHSTTVANNGYLILRNNLTIVEIVPLSGRGAVPHFKFGNRKPNSQQPLMFEFGDKHLKECEGGSQTRFNLRRSFTAKNNGELPIFINNFFVNQLPCEGYGFKVLNCEPVVLLPNASRKIDIEFTPDFTLARVTRTLVLDTSLNFSVNYTLVTTVPPYYLASCSNALERPEWEPTLYSFTVSLMLLALVIAIALALMDSEKICLEAVMLVARQNPVQHTLDLRSIGAQTRQELQTKPEVDAHAKADHVLKLDDLNASPGTKMDEKYTAVIPSTGKGKKKNRKTCDLQVQAQERENHKKMWMETQKLKQEEHKLSETKVRKSCNTPQPKNKVDLAPNSEEETLSTTTESSNGDEKIEPRKENNKEKKKAPQLETRKVSLTMTESPVTVVKEEKENVYPSNSPPIPSSNGKVDGKPNKLRHRHHSHTVDKEKVNGEVQTTIEKVKPTRRERKEKYSQQSQKKHLAKANQLTNRISPSFPHPPQTTSPVPSTIWNENKASFSDVVARSETTTTPVTPTMKTATCTSTTTKPTMYVEPYKQSPIVAASNGQLPKLGPIGSRALWNDMNHVDHNRFYSEAHNMAMESTNMFLDVNNPWTGSTPWVGPNSTNSPTPAYYNHAMQPQQQAPNATSGNSNERPHSSNYLWGSSVWEPLTPPARTRTPPGFAPQVARLPEDAQVHALNYNPFGYSNIWTQPQRQGQAHGQHPANSNPWMPHGQ